MIRNHPPIFRFALAALALGALGAAGYAAAALPAAPRPTTDAAAPPLRAELEVLRAQSSYRVRTRFNGVVRSRRSAPLGFERAGRIAEIFVDEGDAVSPGQLLARLDTQRVRAELRRLRSAVKEAEAGVGISELTAQRLGRLAASQFASKQRSDEARFGLSAAEAQRDTLLAAVAQSEVELRKSRLVAPFAGVVSARRADDGTVVAAGSPVLQLLELRGKEAIVGLPAQRRAALPVGSTVSVEIAGRPARATVTGHVEDIDTRTRTAGVVLALAEAVTATDGELVHLELEEEVATQGFWVPHSALSEGLRGLWQLYAVQETGGVQTLRREVVAVLHTEAERAFVQGTLSDGDRIVRRGVHRFVPGQRVRTVLAQASTASAR